MHAMSNDLRDLHEALLDLSGIMNRPQPDAALIAEAGIQLDRALFPLLVRIDRRGPIGVVELADLAGRDHSTVSRQVAKLEAMGLVTRPPDPKDGRVRAAATTAKARELTAALDKARERLWTAALASWSPADRRDLVRLLRKLADQATDWVKDGGQRP
jgi:DNA-binding MarR family transcriptional regulator